MNDDAREAEFRWGETDAYRESQRRMRAYTEFDRAQMDREQEDIIQAMASVMQSGDGATSEQAQSIAERHRQFINSWFYSCDHWMHARVAEMYIYDERFAAFFNKSADGLATFFAEAVDANALTNAEGPAPDTSALADIKAAAGVRAALEQSDVADKRQKNAEAPATVERDSSR